MYGDNAKYIIVKTRDNGEYPIIFPLRVTHKQMATRNGEPISAGFVNDRLECFGESDSLGIKSRPEDTAIIKDMFGTA